MDAFAFRFHQSGQVEREGGCEEGEGGTAALLHCRSVRRGIACSLARPLEVPRNVNFESGPLKKKIPKEEGELPRRHYACHTQPEVERGLGGLFRTAAD